MDLSHAGLHLFPDLHDVRISTLNVSFNSIQIVWDEHLPQEVGELSLADNCIGTDGLPTEWPPMIHTLSLAYNPFRTTDIITGWPAALRTLNLSHTSLREFPRNLPDTIESLTISHTFVTQIGYLPRNLKELYADVTDLKFLPYRCPEGLEILVVSRGKLRNGGLPTFWGSSLKRLDLNSNSLRAIPRGLPSTLEFLNLSQNSIREFGSESLYPLGLQTLHLGDNQILELPEWIGSSSRRHLRFTIHQNYLVEPVIFRNCILWSSQWVGPLYTEAATYIQRAWRKARMRRRLKAIYRMTILREELLALAMHPDRVGRFEPVDPIWGL
jgi:Leucine-rich repeat (LRR) protein